MIPAMHQIVLRFLNRLATFENDDVSNDLDADRSRNKDFFISALPLYFFFLKKLVKKVSRNRRPENIIWPVR
jgi:hypothetical protein